MFLFYMMIFIIIMLSPISTTKIVLPHTKIVSSKHNSPQNIYYLIITILTLIFISGFRVTFIDTDTYRFMYLQTGKSIEYALSQTDVGFFLYMLILNYITSNSQLLIFLSAVIVTLLITRTLYIYSSDIRLSLFLYVTSGIFAFSMNGLRQFIAVSIIFASIQLILVKRKWTFFLVVIIATSFHSSAIIFLPMYFLLQTKVFSYKIVLPLLVVCISLIFADRTIPLLFSFLGDTNYGVYEQTVLAGKDGANIIRVLVEAMPCMLAFFLYLQKNKDIFNNNNLLILLTNMSLYNLMFYLFAMQSWIFARVSIYFSIFNLILIPMLLSEFFDIKNRIFLKYIIYLLYFIYFYYQMKIGYGITTFRLDFNIF